VKAPGALIFSLIRHFHFTQKRSMVPRDFTTGEVGLSINIKGLVGRLSLWRAV
jgi:hypothetical protein